MGVADRAEQVAEEPNGFFGWPFGKNRCPSPPRERRRSGHVRRRNPPLPAAAAATPDDCETDDNVLREIRTLQDGICLDACQDDATKAHGTNGVKGPVAVAVRVTLTRLAPKSPVRRRHRRRWGTDDAEDESVLQRAHHIILLLLLHQMVGAII